MKRTRKIFALLLSICMIVTMLPTVAFAASAHTDLKITKIKVGTNEEDSISSTADGSSTGTVGSPESLTLSNGKAAYSKEAGDVAVTFTFGTTADNAEVAVVKADTISGDTIFNAVDGTVIKGTVSNVDHTVTLKLPLAAGQKAAETDNKFAIRVKETSYNLYYTTNIKMAQASTDTTLDTVKPKEKTGVVAPTGVTGDAVDLSTGSGSGNVKDVELSYEDAISTKTNTFTSSSTGAVVETKIVTGLTKESNQKVETAFNNSTTVVDETTPLFDAAETEGGKVWLVTKVTAQDETTVKYYVFYVTVKAKQKKDASIHKVEFSVVRDTEVKAEAGGAPFAGNDSGSYQSITTNLPYSSHHLATIKVELTVDAGATVTWSQTEHNPWKGTAASSYSEPADGTKVATINSTDFTGDNVLYIEVTSENKEVKKYYKLSVTMDKAKTDAYIVKEGSTVAGLALSGTDADNDGNFDGGPNDENASELTVTVPKGTEKANIVLQIAPNAKAEHGTVAGSVSASGKLDSATGTYTIADSSVTSPIYVKVTAQNGENVKWYKVVISEDELLVVETPKVEVDENEIEANKNIETGTAKAVVTAAQGISVEQDELMETLVEKGKHYSLADAKKAFADAECVRVISYLDIDVEQYSKTSKIYIVDITPMYYVAAAENPTGTLYFENEIGHKQNAAKIDEGELTISDPVEMKIDLPKPKVFDDTIYVRHVGHIYEDTTPSDDAVTFINPDGFSPFVINNNQPVAKIKHADDTSDYYDSLQDAVDAVDNGETITISSNLTGSNAKATVKETKKFKVDTQFTGTTVQIVDQDGTSVTKDSNGWYNVVISNPSGQPGGTTPGGSTGDTTGGGSTGGTTSNHNVTVKTAENGTVTASAASNVAPNTEVTLTVKPAEGYVLDNLTAKTDSGQIDLTKKDDATYTFKMPAADVTVTAAFKQASSQPEPPPAEDDTVCAPYTDVDSSYAYHDQVHYMIENKLMTGVSNNTFGLNVVLNRAMVAQILYSKAEPTKPSYTVTKSFSDVKAGDWFANSVTWAESNGVTAGYGDGTFRPYNQVTREELVTMLYGEADQPDVTGGLSAYTDASSVSNWAVKAMTWAIENGVVTGTTATTLSPKNTTPRYQAAIMFYKYFTK